MALSPSGMAAMCVLFLVTVAPVVLLVTSILLATRREGTLFHHIAMWSGFAYPTLLGIVVLLGGFIH